MLGVFILLQAVFSIVMMACSIGLYQDYGQWKTDVDLLFASSLISLVLCFPLHFLTSDEDFAKSKRRVLWRTLAFAIQFTTFGLIVAAFIYGLASNANGACEAAGGTYCQVLRIALGFAALVFCLQGAGLYYIAAGLKAPKPKS